MPAGKSRKGAPDAAPGSGGDRIGALPDEILHRVLSFLPAQQAVQTCVFARRWLHLWKHASGLRIVGADGKSSVPFEDVREFVDSLLLLRGSSPLDTFEAKVTGAAVDDRHLRLWVSRSNNGDCGDWSCKGCIRNETSSVLMHAISQAKEMQLAAGTEMFIFRRDLKWCPTFSLLKALMLTDHHVHALACILEHSPILESLKLYLLVLEEGFKVNVKMNGRFNATELPSTISPHLKRVKIRCGTMDKRVFKVLEFLSKLNISFSFKEKSKAEDESSAT